VRAVQKGVIPLVSEAEVPPRLTFRHAQKLVTPAEFAQGLRAKPAAVSAHFQIFRLASGRGTRLGIVVGKRFVARSVDRNRIKRLMREVFRTTRAQLLPMDNILRARSPIVVLDVGALRAEIDGLFRTR
jgi:ribonuclease P protein component